MRLFIRESSMPTISFKGRHFHHEMILQSVRWYLGYSLSYRNIEEMMAERGFSVDHSTINRWVLRYSPQLDAAFRKKKKRVGTRWRMDETYILIKGPRKLRRLSWQGARLCWRSGGRKIHACGGVCKERLSSPHRRHTCNGKT